MGSGKYLVGHSPLLVELRAPLLGTATNIGELWGAPASSGAHSRQGGRSERSQAEATRTPQHTHTKHSPRTRVDTKEGSGCDPPVLPESVPSRGGLGTGLEGLPAPACRDPQDCSIHLPMTRSLSHLPWVPSSSPGSAWSLESHKAAEHWGSQSWPNPTRSYVCTCCMLNHTCGHTCMHIRLLTCTQAHTLHTLKVSHTHTHSQSRTHIQTR